VLSVQRGIAATRGISPILLEKTDHLSDNLPLPRQHVMATPSQLTFGGTASSQPRARRWLAPLNYDAAAAGVIRALNS